MSRFHAQAVAAASLLVLERSTSSSIPQKLPARLFARLQDASSLTGTDVENIMKESTRIEAEDTKYVTTYFSEVSFVLIVLTWFLLTLLQENFEVGAW